MTFIKAFFTQASVRERWAVGDQAVLAIEEHALVLAALIAYGAPLLLLLMGMALGSMIGPASSGDVNAALGALTGLVCGATAVKLHACFARNKSYYQAQVVGKHLGPVNTH